MEIRLKIFFSDTNLNKLHEQLMYVSSKVDKIGIKLYINDQFYKFIQALAVLYAFLNKTFISTYITA